MNPRTARKSTAEKLAAAASELQSLQCLAGFDGFIDEIVRIVDKRESAETFSLLKTISAFAGRVVNAADKSTNMEMVVKQIKLGGNGPIMANALAQFGLRVTYIGSLGYPKLHPVFQPLADTAEVHSIAEPGHTDALEFEDGKIMLGKHQTLVDVNYENMLRIIGKTQLGKIWRRSRFIGMVNWTMLPNMTDIWQHLFADHCATEAVDKSRLVFFDLADPEKRTADDIQEALQTLARFAGYCRVILGLNEKEGIEIGEVLRLGFIERSPAGLLRLAQEIRETLQIDVVAIHPVKYAVAASAKASAIVDGPYEPSPLLSTGAGDHFNAGFCLACLGGLDLHQALLAGVGTSGYYVRTGTSPSIDALAGFLQNWREPGTVSLTK